MTKKFAAGLVIIIVVAELIGAAGAMASGIDPRVWGALVGGVASFVMIVWYVRCDA